MAISSGNLAGTKNGTNLAFTLPAALISGSEQIVHNGRTLKPVVSSPGVNQCIISGLNVTLGLAPSTNDDLWYYGDTV